MKADCPFCEYKGPSEILAENSFAYIISPLNPAVGGHVLVIPKTHIERWEGGAYAVHDLMETFAFAKEQAEEQYESYNMILNCGEAATQTIAHLHIHIVPRYVGDGVLLPWSEEEVKQRINAAASKAADYASYGGTYRHPLDMD